MDKLIFKKNHIIRLYFMLAWISMLLMHSVNVFASQEKTMIYWTSSAGIHRADLNGESYETLLSVTLSNPQSIAIDAVRGKIYWTDRGSRKIQRANLNGTNVEDLVSTSESSFLFGIAIDPIREKVYWADGGWLRKIQRANLDGSNVEDFITDRNTSDLKLPRAVTIDVDRGKVYWRDSFNSRILRVDLDGTNVEHVVASGYTVEISHVTVAGGKIYWASYDWPSRSGEVKRANLDGSNEEFITTIKHVARSIDVDVVNSKIYWKEYNQSSENGTIYGANLDGTNVEQLINVPGTDTPNSIALNAMESKLYWIESFTTPYGTTGIIHWANLDGTEVKDLINTKLRSPCGLAIDDKAGKIYWTDFGANKIQRANLDGTHVEDIVTTGLSAPTSIALDQIRGKLYWANWKTGSIQRANLNGSNVENIFIDEPRAIALDTASGRIYWTNCKGSPCSIKYANLNGTNVQTLFSSLEQPNGLAIDAKQGKIHWTENGFRMKVSHANLDGTEHENVVTYPTDLAVAFRNIMRGITVDADSSRIYWTEGIPIGFTWPPERIRRVESDGKNIVSLITGLVDPRFVVLGPAMVSDQAVSVDVSGKLATVWGRVRQNALLQNFPNPFNPETWIPYQLSEESEVRLTIYNIKGIFIMDADGKNPRLLINSIFSITGVSWSPDSKWVAFMEGLSKLVAFNINSGERKEIIKNVFQIKGAGGGLLTYEPAWSPDGKKIALRLLGAKDNKRADIYTIDIDENLNGANLKQLTNNDPEDDDSPAWSPDGKQIVFHSTQDGGGLFIMDSDGGNVKLLHRGGISADWSPDGKKIVFFTWDGIFIMNSDRSNVWQVFKEGGRPAWLEQKFFSIESEGKSKTHWGKMKRNF